MPDKRENITVTKQGDTLTLSFVFNSVTKDDFIVEHSTTRSLPLAAPDTVTEDVCRNIEALCEDILSGPVQDFSDYLTGQMNAVDIEDFTNTPGQDIRKYGVDVTELKQQVIDVTKAYKEFGQAFSEKYASLFKQNRAGGSMALNLTPRVIGPAPQ